MEIWKDIIGYEGLYQISNYGRVKTVARDIVRSNGEPLHIKEWASLAEIERQTGFSNSNISACCRGKFKTMYNYMWRYE